MAARLLVLLLAGLTQFHQLGLDRRFHADEAHFMTFARDAAVKGEWMLPGALDKPPLSIYLSAAGMVCFGVRADAGGVLQLDLLVGEFAGRAPNVMLALLTVALLMRLTRRICRYELAALLAGFLAALSPYLLAYGATAFSDMSLLFCLSLALAALEERRHSAAGLALGLAFWCKPQALLLAPLFAFLLVCRRHDKTALMRFGIALTGALVPLLVWDAARPETSVFLLGAVNNTPETWLAAPGEWLDRLLAWLRLGTWLVAAPALTLILLGMAVWDWLRGGGRRHRSRSNGGTLTIYFGYLVAFIGIHSLVALNQYDRYLLPLLPLAVVPLAGHLSALIRRARHGGRLLMVVGVAMLVTTLGSLHLGLPLGGDNGRQTGIEDLARHLNQKPVATVIYDPWLGWELGYYLGVWHDKRRAHYPDAEALAAGALSLDEIGDRFLVAPVDQSHEGWLDALRVAGFGVEVDYERDRFVVYRIVVETAPRNLGA